jgi:hypothetical protein
LKKYIFLFLLFTSCLFNRQAVGQEAMGQDTSSFKPRIQFSIITCAAGEEIYSIWGHTAVRVVDSVNQTDIVFNYGTFNFNEPNFIAKFLKGDLLYFVSVNNYSDFLNEYQFEKRNVYEQVLKLSNAEKIKWNFSPFNFTAEKRLKNGFGMTFMIGSNVYPEGQQISGLTIDEPLDLFNTEVGVKYNFNYLIKEDNKFDPYGIVTGGIWVKADKLLPTYGIGFGFNHWFSNYIGMTSNFQYKILKDFEDNKPDDGLVQIGFGLVHIVN